MKNDMKVRNFKIAYLKNEERAPQNSNGVLLRNALGNPLQQYWDLLATFGQIS